MGAWVAFEFLSHACAKGLSMPVKAFLSAMPHPDLPVNERPWKQQANLDEREFQVKPLWLEQAANVGLCSWTYAISCKRSRGRLAGAA